MALTKISGSVIKDNLSLSGNVSVGGTLTYQDVTNVDALGIGTFRTGIKVLAGQVDIGSNIKLGNAGVITATSFVGSGANLTGITQVGGSTGVDFNDNVKARFGTGNDLEIYHNAVSNILATSNGNIELVAGSEYMAKFIPNGAVELYHNNVKTFATKSGGNTLTGTDSSGNVSLGRFYYKTESGTVRALFDPYAQKFQHYDNTYATFGNNHDLNIFHDGSNTFLLNNTGNIYIQNDGSSTTEEILIRPKSGEQSIRAIANGAVELYHDNSKVLETMTQGVRITDNFLEINDTSCHLDFMENGSSNNHRLRQNAGNLYIQKLSDDKNTSTTQIIVDGGSGAVELYYNGSKTFETISGGIHITGATQSAGHIKPDANNTYDLGTTSLRWRNIYTNDLNLSNEGSTNSVDNTWGNYTIQEGESDLYLINNRNGKKYKFNLTEVS